MSDKMEFEKYPELTEIIQWFASNVPVDISMWSKLLAEINKALALHPSESAGVNMVKLTSEENEILDKTFDRVVKRESAGVGAEWVPATRRNMRQSAILRDQVLPEQNIHLWRINGWNEKGVNFTNGILKEWWELEILQEPGTAVGSGKEEICDHEHEKEIMMQAFDKVRQIFEGRSWIMQGRGSYPYNDDRYKEEVRYMYDEFDTLYKDTWNNIKSKTFEYRNKIIEQYKQESGKEEAVEKEKAKAWDDWKDSLLKYENRFVHPKSKEVNYTEPFTLEEFKDVLLNKAPVFIFCDQWSKQTPIYQITKQPMPSGLEYFSNAWADKTPKHITIEKFYKELRMQGLAEFRF